ncbi:hypothetical protein L1987_07748 [Smallanthus sonchifolius]|uniref:Uncharacterized protein n=1 Tax=Smallanthus sonchifolius TaxID=185202 RepID=A0ACB9JKY3_9ASTR|nr:hypothetical protein L1987_07748 [Smallanthus sonchifolius]
MDGMGRGLALRVHGHSMHGDALTLASFDVIPDWVGDEFFGLRWRWVETLEDTSVEMDACRVNKEQSSILGSNTSSELSAASVNDLGTALDKKGESPLVSQSTDSPSLYAGKPTSAGKFCSVGKLDSTRNAGSPGAVVQNDADSFPMSNLLPIDPDVASSFSVECLEPMHEVMGLSSGPGESNLNATRLEDKSMQHDSHVREPTLIIVTEKATSPGRINSNEGVQEGGHSSSRQNPFTGQEVHGLHFASKGIMDYGFIKVKKKKKKNNGPKPRVQIPSLNVSKPGPSKPLGRARPNVAIHRVTVSNPFEVLDDATQIDDGYPELNATLKKFAMRYVKENTTPDPDVFKTWSKDLKEYYFSLTKDDGEEVESETDGTTKLMSTGVS